MLQRDGLFRRREEGMPRSTPPSPSAQPAPATSASAAVSPTAAPAPAEAAAKSQLEKPVIEYAERKEARLTVGPEIKMKGVEITDCDTLVVEGRVEATLDTRVLQIAEHGAFNGVVSVDVAEIHGRLEGELTVRKQLIVHATGRVSGKIRYARIKVEEGAEIAGDIAVLDRTQAATARAGASASASALAARS
jgi:cytoskeletal protein CcmA (bactofilin family)